MIVGFAHLAYGAPDLNAAVEDWGERGWVLREAYHDVPSPSEKLPLLAQPASRCDVALLGGGIALEVVVHEHGTVPAAGTIDFIDGALSLIAHDKEREVEFLRSALRLREVEADRLAFTSPVPQWNVSLSVSGGPQLNRPPPLDLNGFTCLAFYSTDIEADTARMTRAGAWSATQPFKTRLGSREMDLVMARTPGGTIIELVQMASQR